MGLPSSWAPLAGLRVLQWESYFYHNKKGPTLASFCRSHRIGRFYVEVRHHAVAVIDGIPYGFYGPRSRVLLALRVTT